IALGIVSAGHYAEGRDNPATQEFVKAYLEAYGDIPSYYAAAMYTAAQWLTQAMEAVKGNVEDTQAFLDAVRKVELKESPFGPEKLDAYGNPIFNVYIRRVERRSDGRLWNVVLETIPNVSQFWKWDPEEYLKRPVYSRDYQPGVNPKK
uniref:ABC transporter substrate-binding protein n=1 Tax=Thermoflexus sp. TaxID=1969742 RepID=UPI002ADD6873